MTFALTILLGNAAMEKPADVAHALETLARKLRAEPTEFEKEESGRIYDLNGNRVGGWHVED